MKDVETTRVTDGLLPLSSSVVRYVGAAALSKGEKGRLGLACDILYELAVALQSPYCLHYRYAASTKLEHRPKTGSGSEDESSVRLHEALK